MWLIRTNKANETKVRRTHGVCVMCTVYAVSVKDTSCGGCCSCGYCNRLHALPLPALPRLAHFVAICVESY